MSSALSLHHDGLRLLEYIKEQNVRVPSPIINYIRFAVSVGNGILQQPKDNWCRSPAATATDLSKDREVVLKLGEPAAVQSFRRYTTGEIKNRAEKARIKAACLASIPMLASIKFVVARQLKSDNLCLSLRSAKEAELARCHRDWLVVHKVPVKAMGDLTKTPNWERIGKNHTVIIVFTLPHAANQAINSNTIWDSTVLTTVLYDRFARIR
ncbi:uncharacterized protein ATNIH1004_003947 [Aspergillus tanneri]|uniref:Uncharacterized protein n=1 Tax=Aspergillus tanneri TaxID=1220188 RepID=A0A5M9MRQ8_9EURO|nr:uncharacterized protein ATNIH1004_003947 [Aspergillus tanneri]KAA8648064.1 hypothetical protein ATNIH1004_003947 [Aspergillus tanneri]